jgi:hypothetical protein
VQITVPIPVPVGKNCQRPVRLVTLFLVHGDAPEVVLQKVIEVAAENVPGADVLQKYIKYFFLMSILLFFSESLPLGRPSM